jgi:hypothetical protein
MKARQTSEKINKHLKTTSPHIPEGGNLRNSINFCESFSAFNANFESQNRMSENVFRPNSPSDILRKVLIP